MESPIRLGGNLSERNERPLRGTLERGSRIVHILLSGRYSVAAEEVIEKICSEEFITNDEARRGTSPEEGEEVTPSSSQLLRPHEEEFWKPCFRLIPVRRDLKIAIQD
ncbi:hypothetical protein Salat_2582400 [Sesamum alatum]|uniref:Uncharacterized protein n=1 Tax=Sesamum alatum TaxID=300844 RepID=A0AAE2CAG9_9LAMI|nr:hypothetical protein Salat_2582400 [Sesamum alatum]